MPFGTLLDSGSFVSTGATKILPFVQGASWLHVVNMTEAGANNDGHGIEYYWQAGMTTGDCLASLRVAAGPHVNTAVVHNAIKYVDTSLINTLNAAIALTAISDAAHPVVSTASTADLYDGDIVRIYNAVGARQLGAIDFTVGTVNDDANFTLAYMAQIVAAAAPGATAVWRKLNYDSYFYPKHRYISAITVAGTSATVALTVTHGYQIGQTVRFVVPPVYGMSQINGQIGTITAISTVNNTITVDINVAGYTAFAFPLTSDEPFSPAMVVPVGIDMAECLSVFPPYDILSDATTNTAYRGLALSAGAALPAGQNGQSIFWTLGTSYSI